MKSEAKDFIRIRGTREQERLKEMRMITLNVEPATMNQIKRSQVFTSSINLSRGSLVSTMVGSM